MGMGRLEDGCGGGGSRKDRDIIKDKHGKREEKMRQKLERACANERKEGREPSLFAPANGDTSKVKEAYCRGKGHL